MSEVLAHLAGDYLVQTDWMASEKLHRHDAAAVHALTYTACFLPITRSWKALAVIGGTHFAIDRWRLAKHVCWAKNQVAPARYRYPFPGDGTGYPDSKPAFLNVWLMIIADNTCHLLINRWALRRYHD
jgi:hypothetical protein